MKGRKGKSAVTEKDFQAKTIFRLSLDGLTNCQNNIISACATGNSIANKRMLVISDNSYLDYYHICSY